MTTTNIIVNDTEQLSIEDNNYTNTILEITQGPQGRQGIQGIPGPTGPRGLRGRPGTTYNFSSGSGIGINISGNNVNIGVSTHYHSIENISGLQDSLDSKSNNSGVSEINTSSNINNLRVDNSVIRIYTQANISLGGIAGGQDGTIKTIINSSSDYSIVLYPESPLSLEENRIFLHSNEEQTIAPDYTAQLLYDSAKLRWRVL